jgi:hypothetical protein
MKRKLCWRIFMVIVLALLLTTPALAGEKAPTGERININDSGAQTFQAGEPFYIMHGWGEMHPPYTNPGQTIFKLEVDGAYVKPTFVERFTIISEEGPYLYHIFYFNFPEGMSGEHVFEGHWIIPCAVALEYDWTDTCANPNADFDLFYSSVTVVFE